MPLELAWAFHFSHDRLVSLHNCPNVWRFFAEWNFCDSCLFVNKNFTWYCLHLLVFLIFNSLSGIRRAEFLFIDCQASLCLQMQQVKPLHWSCWNEAVLASQAKQHSSIIFSWYNYFSIHVITILRNNYYYLKLRYLIWLEGVFIFSRSTRCNHTICLIVVYTVITLQSSLHCRNFVGTHRELFYSVLETIRAIILLNISPIVDFRQKK